MPAETTNRHDSAEMRTIAATPPNLAEDTVLAVLLEQYDLAGELKPLLSERDQNWLLVTPGGERFVLKTANAAEDPIVTDFQVRALLHLESRRCPIATPRIVPTRDGEVSIRLSDGATSHVVRVVTFVPGQPMDVALLDRKIAFGIGVAIAHIHVALADFKHAGDEQPLLWDLQRALELRPLLQHVPDTNLRTAISSCLDEFELRSLPFLRASERHVIHGDINPGNVLLASNATSIAGVIDFGDMLRAPVIVDLAIAASYLRSARTDPYDLIASMLDGYHSVSSLAADALAALHGLIRARLATSITLLHWRLGARGPQDAYGEASADSERDAVQFFARLSATGDTGFHERILQIIKR